MNTDQITAEAWENIAKTLQHFGTVPADTGRAIIKAAIEKARPLIEAEHTGRMLELERTRATASERFPKDEQRICGDRDP